MQNSSLQGTCYRSSKRVWAILLIVFLGFVAIPPCKAAHPKKLEPVLAKLDEHINRQLQIKHIPGCAIAVVYKGQVVHLKAYGVKTLGSQEKIDIDTVFQLGSVSKPVAATLASILENKGYFRIEDPVSYHLPQFALKSKQHRHSLKIKHLLSHSTGVPRAGFNNLIEAHAPYPKILKALQNTPVRTTVGKRYDYHNAMYGVISDITESATQLSFNEALRKNLLIPLNMTKTTSTLNGLMRSPNKATPHIKNGNGSLIPVHNYSKGYYAVAPAGGINSTIRDMSIFLKAQMGGAPEVLNHRAIMRIQTPQVATNNVLSPYEGPASIIKNAHYALGWRTVAFAHHKLVFHGGWVKGFTNFIAFMPDQEIGIVVLHNSESKFSSKTAVKFFEMYLDVPKNKVASTYTKTPKSTKYEKQLKKSKQAKYKRSKKKQIKQKTSKPVRIVNYGQSR